MKRWCLFALLLCVIPAGTVQAETATIRILAASSLAESLQEIAALWTAEQPQIKLELQFAGSQTLAAQITEGVPADLFIAADPDIMLRLQTCGLAHSPQVLVRNRLALALRPAAQQDIASLNDLGNPGVLLAVGAPQVPVGRYARQLLAAMAADPEFVQRLAQRISANVATEENQVKAIVAKLLLGEIDAGIVYQSDLVAARRLPSLPLPDRHNPEARYLAAKIHGCAAAADSFYRYLFSPASQQVFRRYGFEAGKS